ncbi:MAG TPA: hypothetical protein VNW99_12785 [Cytophagaceae bacterium]|jgi:hypothetical protein|nr:hypothetical protein [Cytophagaceae bacterium]
MQPMIQRKFNFNGIEYDGLFDIKLSQPQNPDQVVVRVRCFNIMDLTSNEESDDFFEEIDKVMIEISDAAAAEKDSKLTVRMPVESIHTTPQTYTINLYRKR